MKKAIFILGIATVLSLTACGETGTTTNQGKETVTQSNNTSQTTDAEKTQTDNSIGGKFKLEFGSAEKTTSEYEEGDLLMVTYTFTNNSEEAVSADTALMLTGFQDGVEVDKAFDSELTGDNETKSIKPGASIECKALFKLSSTSDLEVEASEFCGLDDSKVVKTYTIQ